MIKQLTHIVLALGLLASAASHAVTAEANVTAYPPATGFPTATTAYNFNGIFGTGPYGSPGDGAVFLSSGSLPVGPVTFSTTNGFLVESSQFPFYGSDVLLSQGDGSSDNILTANISGNYGVIGFTYGSSNPISNSIAGELSITVYTGAASKSFSGILLPLLAANTKFIGFVSPDPITKVVFNQPATSGSFLNIISFQVAAVPEPSVYAMFGAGLALFGMIGRRRSRKP